MDPKRITVAAIIEVPSRVNVDVVNLFSRTTLQQKQNQSTKIKKNILVVTMNLNATSDNSDSMWPCGTYCCLHSVSDWDAMCTYAPINFIIHLWYL